MTKFGRTETRVSRETGFVGVRIQTYWRYVESLSQVQFLGTSERTRDPRTSGTQMGVEQ